MTHLRCDRWPILRDQDDFVLLARDGVSHESDHCHAVTLGPPCGAKGALPRPFKALGILSTIREQEKNVRVE